jgi:hypothetical protein
MRFLLAALVLAPCVALAQQGEPPATPPPSWSLGAGVSAGDYLLAFAPSPFLSAYGGLTTTYGVYASPSSAESPGFVASLERAFGNRTWLLLGVAASAQVDDYDSNAPTPSAGGVLHGTEYARGEIEFGLRSVMTSDDAPVAVSWLGSVQAGFAHAKSNVEYAGAGSSHASSEAWFLAGTLGLAVERALGDRLAVRVATPLVRVVHGEAEQRDSASPLFMKAKSTGLAVLVAPRLELRLYF